VNVAWMPWSACFVDVKMPVTTVVRLGCEDAVLAGGMIGIRMRSTFAYHEEEYAKEWLILFGREFVAK